MIMNEIFLAVWLRLRVAAVYLCLSSFLLILVSVSATAKSVIRLPTIYAQNSEMLQQEFTPSQLYRAQSLVLKQLSNEGILNQPDARYRLVKLRLFINDSKPFARVTLYSSTMMTIKVLQVGLKRDLSSTSGPSINSPGMLDVMYKIDSDN